MAFPGWTTGSISSAVVRRIWRLRCLGLSTAQQEGRLRLAAPVNLGSGVNAAANDMGPSIFEDEETGALTLYFASNRAGGMGSDDIYASTLQPDETFGPAVLVEELSSPFPDRLPSIRRDGQEISLTSDRPGGFGSLDLWVSTRASTSNRGLCR